MNSKRIIATAKLPVLHAIVLACVLLLPSGCLKDLGGEQQKAPVKTEEVILTIANTGNSAEATRASDINDECKVEKILVLQLEAGEPNIIRRMSEGEPVDGSPGSFRVELLETAGSEKWKIIVAGYAADFEFWPDPFKYLGQPYKNLTNALAGTYNLPISNYTVTTLGVSAGMAYLNGSSDLKVSECLNGLSIKLLRALAKVDIGVGKYNEKNNTWSNSGPGKIPFELVSVEARSIRKDAKKIFNIDKETFDPSIPAVKKASIKETFMNYGTCQYSGSAIISGTYIKNTIYFVENELSGTRYDKDHLKRPRLIIGGKYDGGPTTYYRIDFSGLDGGSKDSFTSDILRNHLYRFTINSVSGPGQETANEADATIPETLDFTTAIEPWKTGVEDTPNQQIGYYMNYEGLNGEHTHTQQTGPIPVKTRTWKGRQPSNIFDYNTFYGEADNFWAHLPSADPGNWNGDLYATANGEVNPSQYEFAALKTEGAYPTLMIAANNLVNVKGDNTFPWKEGQALTAFDMCRAYNGGGFSDWRLPRLSELALMYANRAALEALSGFEPFGENAVYWSGSEYGEGRILKSSEAWTFTFTTTDTAEVFNKDVKSARHFIRCVRQP